jgi:outer membrane protein assembly factor BamB
MWIIKLDIMKKKVLVSTIFILMVTFVSAQLADSPWPMYHGGMKHGGQSSVDTSHVNGFVKWTFEAGGGIESSPAIGEDGTIYFGAHDNRLYAVNPNGTLKWSFYVGKPLYGDKFDVYKGILSSPAVAKDGTIYFSSLSDIFFAINADGTEKWRYELPITSDTWTSPVIGEDGTIYTGAARRKLEGSQQQEYYPEPIGGVYAFNPDGTLKWHFVGNGDVVGSPAIGDDGIIYVAVPEGKEESINYLKAINPDGTEKWKLLIRFSESSPSVGPDGTVYIGVGHFNKGLVAINPDGTEKWFFQTGDDISATPAIGADGTVYVGSWDYNFYAINPDGTLKWKFETPPAFEGVSSSAAIGADGTIYFGSNSGNFYALNPDGTEKWHIESLASIPSSPAIGKDGTVYVGSWNNKLYAFGEGDIEETVEEQELEYNQNLSEEEKRNPDEIYYENITEEIPSEKRNIPKDLHEEPADKRSFLMRILDWLRNLFG